MTFVQGCSARKVIQHDGFHPNIKFDSSLYGWNSQAPCSLGKLFGIHVLLRCYLTHLKNLGYPWIPNILRNNMASMTLQITKHLSFVWVFSYESYLPGWLPTLITAYPNIRKIHNFANPTHWHWTVKHLAATSPEPRKKSGRILSIEAWLFNKDPSNGLL